MVVGGERIVNFLLMLLLLLLLLVVLLLVVMLLLLCCAQGRFEPFIAWIEIARRRRVQREIGVTTEIVPTVRHWNSGERERFARVEFDRKEFRNFELLLNYSF